ncbi:D-sedoheptulose-7-phosphate isomerase [Nonomuraea salmonea]|uniref:D-sedoheptulose-7-phosphate isomerase n=1 Tax=Nonomuraea salmonea TaxID=46181 RepID=UPI0031E92CCD
MPELLAQHVDGHLAAARGMAALLPAVEATADLLIETFTRGGTLYTVGNGGSAADAQHLTGELIGHYRRDRRPLPAVTLTTDATVMTCIANDYVYDDVFARQVQALARRGDVVAAFTTSGNSPNVVGALQAAQTNGAVTVLFGGGDGGKAAAYADHLLLAPPQHRDPAHPGDPHTDAAHDQRQGRRLGGRMTRRPSRLRAPPWRTRPPAPSRATCPTHPVRWPPRAAPCT